MTQPDTSFIDRKKICTRLKEHRETINKGQAANWTQLHATADICLALIELLGGERSNDE